MIKNLNSFDPNLINPIVTLIEQPSITPNKPINLKIEEKIKLAIQINGKTRDIINVEQNTSEDQIKKIIFINHLEFMQ